MNARLRGVSRRTLLRGSAALIGAPWLSTHPTRAHAADLPRFGLGVASGHPRADTVVLWTRLTGPALPERVMVSWEIALDENFREVVAKGEEIAEAAWAHSVHAEPSGLAANRWYWYRFQALGDRSPTGRTRTAPAADSASTLNFAIASCQRYDVGHYAAWRHLATEELDLVMFLGDYIYEYPSGRNSIRPLEGSGIVRTLEQYRARYTTHKSDPALQAAHAHVPWLMVWDDHEVGNDYAGLQGQELEPDFRAQRAAAYQAYWEHLPFPKSARPTGADMRITDRLDWGTLARIHLLDDRQYRDPQACPKPNRGGSNTSALKDCPAYSDPKRTLLGAHQERWLAEGWDTSRPWNLLAQQTLMARFSWSDPSAAGGGTYWSDGWDGYAPARQRLFDGIVQRKVGGVVVLGGDVHSNYVADLKLDFDDPKSPTIATEYCGTSITSLSLAQSRIDAVLGYNPHVLHGRSDHRGYMRFALDAQQLQVQLRVLDNALDPGSRVTTSARFTTQARQSGAVRA